MKNQTVLYMDIHKNIKELTKQAAEGAHQKDLEVQGEHGVKFHNYWYKETDGIVFCFAEAPNKEAFAAVLREVHGLMAGEIIEVNEGGG